MANLIKNGDFSQQGNEWTETNPDNVSYVNGHCTMATPAAITQDVPIGDGAGGQFMLSARMKTLSDSSAKIEVWPLPKGNPVGFQLLGGEDWIVLSQKFEVPPSATMFRVTLEAENGKYGYFGAFFGDVTISKLN
ncbi:hypothetical protein [Pseudomonas sp.]|jgi:hypothetical protein|uniref:hypothetical protein n=1 Tax=Pseudomonas sp. TaxID=306 RepID=UPI003265EE2F